MESYLLDAPCLYFASTDDNHLVEVNHRLCEQLGYIREELIGQKLDIICTVATRIFQQTHFFPLLKMQGQASEIYITLQAKNREVLPILINAERKVVDGRGITTHVGIVVNNRKKFEDELVAARKAAETALNENTALAQAKEAIQLHAEQLDQQVNMVNRQNEELKQFNRVVTHDLQEPLRKLFVFTNMLLESEDEAAKQKAATRISSVAAHMRAIMMGLQQYVWLTDTKLKLEKVNLNDVVRLCQLKVEQENPSVPIRLRSEQLPTIEADVEQMRFLFCELLTNAVRFRKPEEDVQVSISCQELLLNKFRSVPGKYKYVDHLKIEISDNGIGMEADYKEQALELFRRLHITSGRGVGLSLCKKIVENHAGQITLDSKVQRGTTITIWLPFKNTGESNTKPVHKQKMLNGDG